MINLKQTTIMKQRHLKHRALLGSWAVAALGIMLLGSCAGDGFDENEKWESSVKNATLTSPELSFSSTLGSDGSEKVKVSWDVVKGAGGYETFAYNVDDPSNPVLLVADTVDATSFTFAKAEDTNYEVSVRTLGNTKLNNTAASEATTVSYSTLVAATTIPVGNDIAEFIKANLKESNEEQAFELEAGGQYTCNGEIDFQGNKMTLRGNKVNHAVVTFGEEGVIRTSAQLKLKFIDFDCTLQGNKGGVVELSNDPPASCSAEAQGVNAGKNSNKPADVYVLQDPIVFQECAFKNVACCLFSVGQCSWGVTDVRVDNCVVQLKNDGKANSNGAVINAYSVGFKSPSGGQFWYGGIKNMTIKNSTIYNIVSNSKNRMFRFNNKDLDRVFPQADGSCTMTNNTFCKVFDKKEFGNNTPNTAKYAITYDNNIFYDCFRLQKFIQGNCTVTHHQELNTVWGVANSVDNTDKTKWATEEDAAFVGPYDQELDFTQANYGVNFKATGAISSTIGDPRWLE